MCLTNILSFVCLHHHVALEAPSSVNLEPVRMGEGALAMCWEDDICRAQSAAAADFGAGTLPLPREVPLLLWFSNPDFCQVIFHS